MICCVSRKMITNSNEVKSDDSSFFDHNYQTFQKAGNKYLEFLIIKKWVIMIKYWINQISFSIYYIQIVLLFFV